MGLTSHSDCTIVDGSDVVREGVANYTTNLMASHDIIAMTTAAAYTIIDQECISITVRMRLVGRDGDNCYTAHTQVFHRGCKIQMQACVANFSWVHNSVSISA